MWWCIDWVELVCEILHATPKPIGVADSNFFLTLGLYPVVVSTALVSHYKIPFPLWYELPQKSRSKSLRQLAGEYGVSHEAVRRTLKSCLITSVFHRMSEVRDLHRPLGVPGIRG
jgi:hypothetical protein